MIGRLPVFAALEQLTVDDLVRILKEPEMLQLNNTRPCFLMMWSLNSTMKLKKLLTKPSERKTGARGLRSIIEETMLGNVRSSKSKCENGFVSQRSG